MNITKFIICISISLMPIMSYGAFNKAESNELQEINNKSNASLNIALTKKNNTLSIAIKNNPDKKKELIELDSAWEVMINKKCIFENVESSGSDAFITLINKCAEQQYNSESEYFNSILP